MKPDDMEVTKRVFSDMQKFAKASKLKKLQEKHMPKPMHPAVRITIEHPPSPHPMDDMKEEELEHMMGQPHTQAEEDAEEE